MKRIVIVVMPAVLLSGCSTTNDNKALVRRYIEEVVNTGNVAHLERFVSPDYAEVYERVRHPVGLEGARGHVLGVRQTYPDLHLTIEQQIAEGEWVVTRVTARGTHLGSWMGMRPTGKAVEITAVNIDRVVGGRIVEHGGAADLLGPLLKIGAVKAVSPEDGAREERHGVPEADRGSEAEVTPEAGGILR